MNLSTHKHRIQLLKSVITTLENNSGVQKPGFGRDKEFGLVLANNKYKLPEKAQKEMKPEPTLAQPEKTLDKSRENKSGLDLTMKR